MTVGFVFAQLSSDPTVSKVKLIAKSVIEHTPAGRYAAIAWPVGHTWKASTNVEGPLATLLLGAPRGRLESRETEPWLLHSNVFVRTYRRRSSGAFALAQTIQVLVIRRTGVMPYARRKDLEPDAASRSLLDTGNPVFTRDVANNVWHLQDDRPMERIRSRLALLCSWSDEQTLSITEDGRVRKRAARNLGLSFDLVGRATKVALNWPERPAPGGQLQLFT